MARITREQARRIAKNAFSDKMQLLKDDQREIYEKIEEVRINSLPEDLKDVYLKYKDSTQYVRFELRRITLRNSKAHSTSVEGTPKVELLVDDDLFNRYRSNYSRLNELERLIDFLAENIYRKRTIRRVLTCYPELVCHFSVEHIPNSKLIGIKEFRDLINC